jgi:hypothetical protein
MFFGSSSLRTLSFSYRLRAPRLLLEIGDGNDFEMMMMMANYLL